MTAAIEVRALTKTFGAARALDGVDLNVPEGSVFGFLGPNGAGKTTTLRILSGLARPDSGQARIFGSDVVQATNEVRAMVGYLPDVPGFYGWMSAEEFLRFAADLFGIEHKVRDQRVAGLLDLAGLAGVRTKIAGYSRGMKQRLGIAQALINAPKLLMLDEPTSALDPIGRKEVLDMIGGLAGRTTVFFSTHVLSDIERVCDTVAVLDHGRVVAEAPIGELKSRYGTSRLVLEPTGSVDEIADALRARAWAGAVARTGEGALELTVSDPAAAHMEIPALLVEHHVGLVRLESAEVSLEDVFVDLVGGDN